MKRILVPRNLPSGITGRRFWKRSIAFVFFGLILAYGSYQTRHLIRGPSITVLSPADDSSGMDGLIAIRGKAERISHLYLNGGLIYTDEDGYFEERLLLAPGYNIITLEAHDKFGREVNRVLHLAR